MIEHQRKYLDDLNVQHFATAKESVSDYNAMMRKPCGQLFALLNAKLKIVRARTE